VNINKSSDNLTVVLMYRLLGHNFNWEDTTILNQEPFYKKRLLSEMLHICQQKNGLNIQSDTSLLNDSYLPIINKCLVQNLPLPCHLLSNFTSFFLFSLPLFFFGFIPYSFPFPLLSSSPTSSFVSTSFVITSFYYFRLGCRPESCL